MSSSTNVYVVYQLAYTFFFFFIDKSPNSIHYCDLSSSDLSSFLPSTCRRYRATNLPPPPSAPEKGKEYEDRLVSTRVFTRQEKREQKEQRGWP